MVQVRNGLRSEIGGGSSLAKVLCSLVSTHFEFWRTYRDCSEGWARDRVSVDDTEPAGVVLRWVM